MPKPHTRVWTALLLCLLLIPAPLPAAPRRQVIDYVFLIDTSGSMMGLPRGSGNVIIFPKVQKIVQAFLADVGEGSNVFIGTFDSGLRGFKHFSVEVPEDAQKAQQYVAGLKAAGNNTWLYRSFGSLLDRVAAFKKQHAAENHLVLYYIYTDGVDNDPARPSLKAVMDRYRRLRGPKDWLFFVNLGVRLKPPQVKIIERGKRIRYIAEKAGELHPILIIETRIPFLDFGNLKMTGTAERLELFGIHFRDRLPKGFQIQARPRFRGVEQAGGALSLTPLKFGPEERVVFRLTLLNKDNIRNGTYSGSLDLVPSDPLVIVSPDQIAVRFAAEPERTVNIHPGTSAWPLEMGTLRVWDEAVPVASEQQVVLQYNDRARKVGGQLQVRIVPDPANPASLKPGDNFLINERPTITAIVKPPAAGVELTFRASRVLPPGTYRGKLVFSSDDLTVSGVGLNPAPTHPGALVLDWSFTVPKAPWPAWVRYGLLALGILAVPLGLVFGLAAFRGESVGELIHGWMLAAGLAKPRLKDAVLEVMEPRERRGMEIDLANQQGVTLGRGGEHLQDAEVTLRLELVVEGRPATPALRVRVSSGEAFVKRATERKELPLEDAPLYDGDVLRFGKYKVRLNSFSLQRE